MARSYWPSPAPCAPALQATEKSAEAARLREAAGEAKAPEVRAPPRERKGARDRRPAAEEAALRRRPAPFPARHPYAPHRPHRSRTLCASQATPAHTEAEVAALRVSQQWRSQGAWRERADAPAPMPPPWPQERLEEAEAELDKSVMQSKQFQQMKRILERKNAQLQVLREQIAKYEPDAAADE